MGTKDQRLHQVLQGVFLAAGRIDESPGKEEQILFPMIRELEASNSLPAFHCGSVGNPDQTDAGREHDDASELLQNLRRLTDNYQAPECPVEACRPSSSSCVLNTICTVTFTKKTPYFPAAIALEEQRKPETCGSEMLLNFTDKRHRQSPWCLLKPL